MDFFLFFLILCFLTQVVSIILQIIGIVNKGPEHLIERYFKLSKRIATIGFFIFLLGFMLYMMLAYDISLI